LDKLAQMARNANAEHCKT